MDKNNVYSSAKVISSEDSVQDYQLGTFVQNSNAPAQTQAAPQVLTNPQAEANMEPVLNEIRALSQNIQQIS